MSHLMQNHIGKLLPVIAFTWIGLSQVSAQCDGTVPNLVVDLSSSPSATYLSPSIVRNGHCCGVSGNDRCLRFELTLHPDAQGINFQVCAGAVPGGSMFYQINCGPPQAVGAPICLDGVGPHILTFCKPGNNDNQYCITSIPEPSAGPSISVSEGCIGNLTSSGFAPGSVQWSSIYPGTPGQYNNYLACPTCANTAVTGQAGYPAYVDYQVCGLAMSPCSNMAFCDTVRVNFYSTLAVTIEPATPTVCFGAAGTNITAVGSGGLPPYSFTWSNGATTAGIFVGPGTYTVSMSDATNCPPTTASVTVTQFLQPIQAFAGSDILVCGTVGPVQLAGSVTGVSTGIWSGGAGQYQPTNTALNATYVPTQNEINAGFVDLVLSTTNNGTCPGAQDVVRITFDPGILNASVTATNATCNGSANGSASFAPALPGNTYSWNPSGQTTAMATDLAAGQYSVTVTNAAGCTLTLPATIGQPGALQVASITATNESCLGTGDGSVNVEVNGGTAPYSYTWNVPGNGPILNGTSGDYTVMISDANGCAPIQASATIAADGQPNVADAGADFSVCLGEFPIQLSGSVINATGGSWSGGSGQFTGNGLNAQYTPTMAEIQAGSVVLTLTTIGNSTCPAATDQVTLYLSNTFLNADLIPTNVNCAGGSNGTLLFTPALPGSSYSWPSFPIQTGPFVMGVGAGQYAVEVTDQYGCSETFNATITQPGALVVNNTNTIDATCFGYSDGAASVMISGGVPPYTYQWNSGGNGPSIQERPAGTHTVSIVDANGCTLLVPLQIGQPAPLTFSAYVPDTVCVNVPVALNAVVNGGTAPYTVQWAGIGSGSSITHSFTASQIVEVNVTDANGCPSQMAELPVHVLDLASAELTTYGDTIVCPGGYTYVGAMLQDYAGDYQMVWPFLDTTGSGPFLQPITSDMTLNVIVTDQCANTRIGTIELGLETPPTIVLPAMIARGCAPLTVQMPDDLTDDQVSYSWNFGNGSTSGQQAPIVVFNSPGSYNVSLTVTTPIGCTASAETTGQVIALAPPQITFEADPWITDIDHNEIDFTPQSISSLTYYSWSFGDGAGTNAINPTHAYSAPGSYHVMLTVQDVNGCTNTAEGLVQINPVYDIVVPNIFTPDAGGGSSGEYHPLDLSNDVFYPFVRFVDDFRMRIFNRWGELLFESRDLARGWDGYYRDQLSPQDVYVYQLWVRFIDGVEKNVIGDVTLMR